MIGKIIGIIILGALAAVCFYSAELSHSSRDSQGYWMFLAFGMVFFVPMVLVIIKLIGQRSIAFKKIYDKLAGTTQKPQTTRFVPHWFMQIVIAIILLCLSSVIVRVIITVIRIVMGRT